MNTSSAKRPLSKALMTGLLYLYALSQASCSPTYPKEIVDKAIIQLCREEYNVEVKVRILNNTVGVYIPIEGLFDMTLNISKEAAEKINDVLLSVSRVTLSTDAPLDFYIVIAQDPILPEIEVVLIRYVNDIKMLHYDRISRGEFAKRMIIDIKLTPQAQKEKVLRDIFGRLNIKEADELITEYLSSSEATTIGDIGYWNNTFFIKDIGMGEFLAMQIADRVKSALIGRPKTTDFKLSSIKGEYMEEGGKRFFRFSFDILPVDTTDATFAVLLAAAADVLHGYKFKDFWNIESINSNTNQVLFAGSDELDDFRKRKMKMEDFRRWYR